MGSRTKAIRERACAWGVLAALIASALLGCAALLDLPASESLAGSDGGDTDRVVDPSRDSSADTEDDGGEPTVPGDGAVINAGDGGSDGNDDDGSVAGRCFVISTFVPKVGGGSTVCNANNVFHGVPGPAGLDRLVGDVLGSFAGVSVSGCIGGKFAVALADIGVRAWSTPKGCTDTCSGASCGTGHIALVFAGANGSYTYAGTLNLGTTPADFTVPVPPGTTPTEVVVCRGGGSAYRDDVNVNELWGTCTP